MLKDPEPCPDALGQVADSVLKNPIVHSGYRSKRACTGHPSRQTGEH